MTCGLRRLAAPAAALALALTGLGALSVSPAGAAAPAYLGANSPVQWNGTDYDDPGPGDTASGVGFINNADENDDAFVTTFPFGTVSAATGTSNYNLALVTADFGDGPQNITIYISDDWFQDAPGGPYTEACAGVDAGLLGGGPGCDAFKDDILTANGLGSDYTFAGYSGFVDASGNPTSDGNTVNGHAPALVWPLYEGSASPVTLDGVVYESDVPGGPGGSGGSVWLPAGDNPTFVDTDGTAIGAFPNAGFGSVFPVHALVADDGSGGNTLYFDGALLSLLDPMNPFPATCQGFNDFLAAASQPTVDCIAFRAAMWAPPSTLGEQYTCASDWFEGWRDANDNPISQVITTADGFSPPSLTPVGVTDGPGVCASYLPPEPPTPPGPPTPPPPDGPDGPGTGGGGSGTGAVPTLPATGVGTPALALAALALLAAGTAFTITTRRRTHRTRPAATRD